MEQERIILTVIISTVVVLLFVVAMIVMTSVYLINKHKLQVDNKNLQQQLDELSS